MRGGKREGAGRKKGSHNKRTAELQACIRASGLDPLQFLIQIMRSPKAPLEMRIDCATRAAPYLHPRLTAVEHSGPAGAVQVETKHYTDIEAVRLIGRFLQKVDKERA
jgi:hypothetical protein